jgi:hypothetical protein
MPIGPLLQQNLMFREANFHGDQLFRVVMRMMPCEFSQEAMDRESQPNDAATG